MPFKRVKTQRRNSFKWDGERKKDGEDDEKDIEEKVEDERLSSMTHI